MKKLFVLFFTTLILTSLQAQRPENINYADAGNFKTAEPVGVGESHYVERGKDFTYTIHFQNEGLDTVYNLRVVDTLSTHLDINSLREEAASHSYNLTLLSGNILRFSFPNIRLPYRAVDEDGSQGFIQFTVSQQENLPVMTFIPNQAAIYFDFQPPVFTNQVFHTIGEEFTNHTRNIYLPGLSIDFSPNPINWQAVVDIQGVPFHRGEMQVFNLSGALLQSRSFNQPRFDFHATDLPSGQLFFVIRLDEVLVATGSFIVR